MLLGNLPMQFMFIRILWSFNTRFICLFFHLFLLISDFHARRRLHRTIFYQSSSLCLFMTLMKNVWCDDWSHIARWYFELQVVNVCGRVLLTINSNEKFCNSIRIENGKEEKEKKRKKSWKSQTVCQKQIIVH